MIRIMRDSTSAADIPAAGTQLVAGYRNGAFAWSPEDYGRFPDAAHVYIDVLGTDPAGAGVVDVEPLDVGVSGAVRWVKARLAAMPGAYPPIVYANRSTLTPLFNAMDGAGLKIVRDFRLWIATLDGTKTVPDMTGVTAVQYAGPGITRGHYDESAVYDDAWHAPADPKPAQLTGYVVQLAPELRVREVMSADDGQTWRRP